MLYQSPLLDATGFEERALPPVPQSIGNFDMGALKIPSPLCLNSDILLVIVLSVSRSNPRQPVMCTGLQDDVSAALDSSL